MSANCFQPEENGVRVFVRLSPKAKREGIEGIYDGADGRLRLKIAVSAPPVDGRANQELIRLLSKICRVPKSSFEITSGQTDRNKTLFISGKAELIKEQIEKELEKCRK